MISRRIALPSALTLLAACGPAEQSAEPTPEPQVAADRPVEAPAPEPPAPPSQQTPALTAEGWGSLRIGMSLAEVTAAAGPDSDPAAVGGPDPQSCDIFRPAHAPEGLRVMIEDGRLARISLSAPTPVKTDRGLGPGDAAAAVKTAYGSSLKAIPHEYEEAPAEYLTAWARGSGGRPESETPDARGIRYVVDRDGRVSAIHAGGPGIQYVEGCL